MTILRRPDVAVRGGSLARQLLVEEFIPGREVALEGLLTRGQLIDRVWGADYVGDTKTLDVHVKRLRSKIEPEPSAPRFLVTVRGLGYKFEP